MNQESVGTIIDGLLPFISRLQQDGFNIGVDSYCTVHNLLLALAAQGELSSDFGRLRTFLAPVLCCSEQEQISFNRYFDEWLQVLQPQPQMILPMVEELAKVEKEQKKTRKSFYLLAFLIVLGFAVIPYRNYLGELISLSVFGKLHPESIEASVKAPIQNPALQKLMQMPLEDLQKLQVHVVPSSQEIPQPAFSNRDKIKFALWATLAVLVLTLLWYLIRYAQLQRFLKRHSALQPPDLTQFFLKNQQQALYSSVAFARTAQQLHKHRDLDTHLLDVEATVKRTIAECGFYTPVYKAIKALPEYLVLIDRASFNDQLSHFVEALLKELDDFGLFIERYYFDGDPRHCYSMRQPTTPCTLEHLQSLYASHRLMIFADSQHFLDPISGKLYGWLSQFHEWQQPFLFTLESPQHWDYYKQQLHEAGFVVLATGQQGLQELVSYIASDVEIKAKQRGGVVDGYPALLQQRPRRFLERHAPVLEIIEELLTQLHGYLGHDGFVWLAACAVYPELHWQLTLYLGQRKDPSGFKNLKGLDEALLLRLARLPWLRYGYMPDWLREALIFKLNKQQERTIRQRLQVLLLTITTQGSADAFSLSIAQKSPLLSMMREVLLVWGKKSDADSSMQDYVFQSFMAGRLTVKLPKAINQRLRRFEFLVKMRLLLVLLAIVGVLLPTSLEVQIIPYLEYPSPPKFVTESLDLPKLSPLTGKVIDKEPAQKAITMLAPAMVAIKGGCFMMGSPESEPERQSDEKQHQVCVTDFEMGKYEVTQAQWQAVMGNNPSKFNGDDLPVETVSWNEVQAFIKKLNALTGKEYRLPTEAEWEYAARAGTTTPFYTGNCISLKQANYGYFGTKYADCKNETADAKRQTVKVGFYPPNQFGLYDMVGNVWEWTCSDYVADYDGSEKACYTNNDDKSPRVLRGGSWDYDPDWLRSAYRSGSTPDYRNYNFGFRLSRM
jgi:formylglycine-generating enzyme required for sulfatase activity